MIEPRVLEGSQAEAFDACEDLVGRLVPPERLGVLVDRLDVLGDRLLQLDGRAVNPRLICFSVRSAKNLSTWLSHEAEVGVKCTCQRGRLANQSRISFVLCVE